MNNDYKNRFMTISFFALYTILCAGLQKTMNNIMTTEKTKNNRSIMSSAFNNINILIAHFVHKAVFLCNSSAFW